MSTETLGSQVAVRQGVQSLIGTHRVLGKTCGLLSSTLTFSAAIAAASTAFALPHPGLLLTLTGFMGYTLGPILGQRLALPNGHQVAMMAMGGAAAVFAALSAHALFSRKDVSIMGGLLLPGIGVAFLAGLGAFFFDVQALSLTVSAAFVLLSGGLILIETNRIVRGGETNDMMVTVPLHVSSYTLSFGLLTLFGFGSSSD